MKGRQRKIDGGNVWFGSGREIERRKGVERRRIRYQGRKGVCKGREKEEGKERR